MNNALLNPTDTGLEVIDLQDDAEFAGRRLHTRDAVQQMEGLKRVANAFVERPDTILQELVDAAVALCGADSAGISLEREDGSDAEFYKWVATAGSYVGFLDAVLPRNPSACGICLERGRPQLFRVSERFFEILGVEAPTVTDGILLPWQVGATRGTIFIMAHGRREAFDGDDLRMMQVLADFAAMGVRQQQLQKLAMQRERAAAAAAMANDLAHQINNPLQGLTNLLFVASVGQGGDAKEVGRQALELLERLSTLVQRLLTLPAR